MGFVDTDGDSHAAEEKEADDFAQALLIPPARYRRFRAAHDFSEGGITAFAQAMEISPAMVVGRLQHDGILPPSHLNGLRRRLAWDTSSARG